MRVKRKTSFDVYESAVTHRVFRAWIKDSRCMARSLLKHLRESHGGDFCGLVVRYYPKSVNVGVLLEKGGDWLMYELDLVTELGEVFDKRFAEHCKFVQLMKLYP